MPNQILDVPWLRHFISVEDQERTGTNIGPFNQQFMASVSQPEPDFHQRRPFLSAEQLLERSFRIRDTVPNSIISPFAIARMEDP